jgi:hypothetical protein
VLITFLDRLGGLFDRRFVVAFWAPAFVALGLLACVAALRVDLERIIAAWSSAGTVHQVLSAFMGLLAVTLIAFLLQALVVPIVRLFEGFGWPGWLADWMTRQQTRVFDDLEERAHFDEVPVSQALKQVGKGTGYHALYFAFPRDSDRMRPTRLGNTLTSAEEYAYQVYNLDSALWWPRLTPLLPETFRAQVDDALASLLALLNLSLLGVLATMASALAVFVTDTRWWLFAAVLVGGLLLARLFYRAALSQADSYGQLIRVGFDLYRQQILVQMHIPVPEHLEEERVLWDALNQWVYRYIPPWEIVVGDAPDQPAGARSYDPFYYDSHAEQAPPQRHEIRVLLDDDAPDGPRSGPA